MFKKNTCMRVFYKHNKIYPLQKNFYVFSVKKKQYHQFDSQGQKKTLEYKKYQDTSFACCLKRIEIRKERNKQQLKLIAHGLLKLFSIIRITF